MQEIRYNPEVDFNGTEDLRLLPITTKSDLKLGGVEKFIIADEVESLDRYFQAQTSGSTGVPLTVYKYPFEHSLHLARWLRILFENGCSVRDKAMSFVSPNLIKQRDPEILRLLQKAGFFRRISVDYTQSVAYWVDAIQTYRPSVIWGFRTTFDLIALEMEKQGIQPDHIRLMIVFGEMLRDRDRKRFQDSFGVKVTEMYGSTEMGGITAYETPARDGLHMVEDQVFFEFLNKTGEPVEPGEKGRIVLTDLTGLLMPLIRYEQGDFGIYREIESSTGLMTRRLDKIFGADDDMVILPDGTQKTRLEFYDAVDIFIEIRQFRIIQKARDQFDVLIVADAGYFDSIHQELLQRLQAIVTPGVRFEVSRVEQIPADPSGKIRMLISEAN